ncbi:MAG: hypothetical protein AUJ98_07845 [Bacteroidetes bacterium CG2_30_33_31]|nr:MAG: hypothetical protein AUJ98_07845 [Bacteroidetes bacterium CG2_30_33_31]
MSYQIDKINIIKIVFPILAILLIISSSCKKNNINFDSNSQLTFSTDTITFDTVFTTIGSSTEYFMIYNSSNKPINVSKIFLANGSNSSFRINIDGISDTKFSDIEIPANDSLYAFVEVTVNPNGGNSPLLITDSVVFETNGHVQDIDLVAYGQDAYYIVSNRHQQGLPAYKIVAGEGVDTTWTNTKPIVIYGYAVVDSTAILRIQAGTKIYFHNGSGLWIYKGGSLKVMGTRSNPVIFQGDRLEKYYTELPGQWDRIWINEGSLNNEINFAIIRNAFIGLQLETLQESMGNNLKLTNTIIENMSGVGILSRFYKLDAENIVVSNCQQYCVALTMGGDYSFKHSTFANYWSYSVRQTPTLYFNNYFKASNDVIYPFNLTKADFINCIIYGNSDEEVLPDSSSLGGNFNYLFDHCLIKSSLSISNATHWKNIVANQNPAFSDNANGNFHLLPSSAALGKGKSAVVPFDIEEVVRDINSPNLGAYEKIDLGI